MKELMHCSAEQYFKNLTVSIYQLYPLTDDIVLISCGPKGLRSLSMRSKQLLSHDPTTLQDVNSAANDVAIDTMILAVCVDGLKVKAYWLVSLQRRDDEWCEIQRDQTDITYIYA